MGTSKVASRSQSFTCALNKQEPASMQRNRHASISFHSPRDEDRRFVRRVNALRSSLDEMSLTLHTTVAEDDWGWFEDVDSCRSSSSCEIISPTSENGTGTTQDISRIVWRMFPPLTDLKYEPAFATSGYAWLASLSSTVPLAAGLELRQFRVVSHHGANSHAEYHLACWIGEARIETWKRFSAFKRFVHTELTTNGHRRSLRAWKDVLDQSRWFRSLDMDYLHQKCSRLETFVHTLLMEAPSPFVLARFMATE